MGTALTVCMKKNYNNFIRQIPYYIPFYVNNPPNKKISREHRITPAAHGLFVYLIVSIEIHAAISPRLPPVYFMA